MTPTTHQNPFTYLAYDAMTMAELDPLPYTGPVPFSRQVNAAGSWGGALPIEAPELEVSNFLGSSNTGRTLLFVDYAGILVWGGMLWTRRYKKSERKLVIGASEMHSYWGQRLQAKDYSTYWEPSGVAGETSPLEIVKKLVEDAKEREHKLIEEATGTGRYIAGGITVQTNYSEAYTAAPPISVSYPSTQLQTIDSIMQTLSQMGYGAGYDYSYDASYKPGTKEPEITLNLWFPRMGRRAAQSGIVILDKNCIDSEYPEDSTQQADSIHVTGSGSGGIQPDEATADNVLQAGYPLLEAMVSHTQINNQSVLADVSLGELAMRAWPVVTPTVELPIPLPNPETGALNPDLLTFGSFNLGDDLIYRVDPVAAGMNSDPRWPKGHDFEWRINSWTATVNEKGVPVLLLDFALPPIEEIPGPMPPLE
jgi:hypothetical protein